jgi:outer membrane protein assembly factor BamB
MGGVVIAWVATAGSLFAQREDAIQWRFTMGGYAGLSSPAMSPDGSAIYIGVTLPENRGGRLMAVTPQGASRWGKEGRQFSAGIEASPTVAPATLGGRIYLGDARGRFYALNPANGQDIWMRSVGGTITSSAALAADGTVYVATSVFNGTWSGQLVAFSPEGVERWRFNTGDLIDSSPAVGSDGTIYVGSADRYLYAIHPSGEQRWRFLTGGKVLSSPAIGRDGTIYFGSHDQKLYALDPNGNLKWDYPTGGQIDASPALGADGTIYFPADRHLYALRPEVNATDRLRWRTDVSSGSTSSPAVRADGVIIAGFDDLHIRFFEPDGRVRWSRNTEARTEDYIESSPLVAPDGSIYIGSLDGQLYKLNGNGSPLSSISSWPGFRRDVQRAGMTRASNADARLLNIATRAQAGGGRPLIAGFVVQGANEKVYLVRAVGPTLAQPPLNVGGAMSDPRLLMHSGGVFFRENDNWDSSDNLNGAGIVDTGAAVGAFPLPAGSRDAALLLALPPGAFTAQVEGAGGSAGVALVEVYDAIAGDQTARVINLSTRGQVGTGANILIAGVVVGGNGTARLLLRGIGPALGKFNVPGVLTRPRLELFRGQTSLGVNTGWSSGGYKVDIQAAASSVAAFDLDDGSGDCAMLFEAQPGLYTVQISGVGDTTGEAMVEVYVLH